MTVNLSYKTLQFFPMFAKLERIGTFLPTNMVYNCLILVGCLTKTVILSHRDSLTVLPDSIGNSECDNCAVNPIHTALAPHL